jgi:hypothetical protein
MNVERHRPTILTQLEERSCRIPQFSPEYVMQAEVEKRNILLKSITDPIGITTTPPCAPDVKGNFTPSQLKSNSKKRKRNDRVEKAYPEKSDDQRSKKCVAVSRCHLQCDCGCKVGHLSLSSLRLDLSKAASYV